MQFDYRPALHGARVQQRVLQDVGQNFHADADVAAEQLRVVDRLLARRVPASDDPSLGRASAVAADFCGVALLVPSSSSTKQNQDRRASFPLGRVRVEVRAHVLDRDLERALRPPASNRSRPRERH